MIGFYFWFKYFWWGDRSIDDFKDCQKSLRTIFDYLNSAYPEESNICKGGFSEKQFMVIWILSMSQPKLIYLQNRLEFSLLICQDNIVASSFFKFKLTR